LPNEQHTGLPAAEGFSCQVQPPAAADAAAAVVSAEVAGVKTTLEHGAVGSPVDGSTAASGQ